MKIDIAWLKQSRACPEAIDEFMDNYQSGAVEATELIVRIIDADKLDWAMWLMLKVMTKPQRVAYTVFVADQVIDLFEEIYPADKRPRTAIEIAKVYGSNPSLGYADAYSLSCAAEAASNAAVEAANDAIRGAAYGAARAASYASCAAYTAARAAKHGEFAGKREYAVNAAYANADSDTKTEILQFGLKLIQKGDNP